ncbi:MAG: hypothetical protein M0R46_14860 [Candidatus Muirbacterium halophilum]|nr:hypothetical protein [Candidatus Muirbacterium halophilum]
MKIIKKLISLFLMIIIIIYFINFVKKLHFFYLDEKDRANYINRFDRENSINGREIFKLKKKYIELLKNTVKNINTKNTMDEFIEINGSPNLSESYESYWNSEKKIYELIYLIYRNKEIMEEKKFIVVFDKDKHFLKYYEEEKPIKETEQ